MRAHKAILAVAVVAAGVAILMNVFHAQADGIHRIRPYVAAAGRDTLSSDGLGYDGKGYKWVACASVGDSTNTAIQMTFTGCGCTIKPNENAIPYADSLVSGAGFMAHITHDNADPVGFSWEVTLF